MRVTGRVATFLFLLAAIKTCSCFEETMRIKRQLFREDIPHNRPLDGAYNQRPQGENNINNNNNNINNNQLDGDSFGGPVRFMQHDAINVHRPPSQHLNHNNNDLRGPISHNHIGNGVSHNQIFDDHDASHFSVFAPGLLQFHQGSTNMAGIKGTRHLGSFENQLSALWKHNYHRNVPSPAINRLPVISYAYRAGQ